MSNWRGVLDSPYSGNQHFVLDSDNENIKNQLLNVYQTLAKLKIQELWFFLHQKNYADAFKKRGSKAVQIPIQSEEIDNFWKPNESHFADIVPSPPDDLSVVDDIPAKN